MAEYLDLNGLSYFKTKQDAQNDGKFALKTSLPTKVSELQNDTGYQTQTDVETAINAKVTNVYRYKGSVDSVDELPTADNTIGDIYDVGSGMNYAWNGTAWDALGDAKLTVDSALSVDSTNPVQNKVIKAALDAKMDADHEFPNATTTVPGFMSAADKEKLDGISAITNAQIDALFA